MQAPPGDSHLQNYSPMWLMGDWADTALLGDSMGISLVQRSLENALVLAGTESAFSTAAMGLCFGIVLEMVLVRAHTEPTPFCLSSHPTSERAEGAQGVGRGHSQDSWSQMIKEMFHKE